MEFGEDLVTALSDRILSFLGTQTGQTSLHLGGLSTLGAHASAVRLATVLHKTAGVVLTGFAVFHFGLLGLVLAVVAIMVEDALLVLTVATIPATTLVHRD